MIQECWNIIITGRRQNSNGWLFFLIIWTLSSLTCAGQVRKTTVKAGNYGDAVVLAFDSASSEISGYTRMDEHADDNPNKVVRSCYIMFTGKCNGTDNCPVDFYMGSDSEKITDGFVNVSGKNLTIKTNRSIDLCESFVNLTDGETFPFKENKPYLFCRSINKEKVYIYSNPNDTSKTKMYLIKHNYVGILKVSGQWVSIEYWGKKMIQGWIKKENLFPAIRR